MGPSAGLLSVVCPACDEEAVLPLFHRALDEALRSLPPDLAVEILYVDDGSRDRTLAVLRGLAERDPRVRYLSLSRNFGHQAALTAGLEHACGDAVVSLDSDLQHPPELIPRLVGVWRAGHDVVLTARADDPGLGRFKRWSSHTFYGLLRRWSDLDVCPNASDYRLLSRRAVDALLRMPEAHRCLRGMVQWLGFASAVVAFRPAARPAGASKYTPRRMLRLALDGVLSFSPVPLRLTVGLGLAAVALSLLASLALAFGTGTGGPDRLMVALLVAVHLVGGCVLGAVGVLGEYVARTFEQVKGRPLYVLKEQGPAAVGWRGERQGPRNLSAA